MIKRALLVLTLCLGAALHAATPGNAIDAIIAGEMPASGAPGVAYAVVEDGAVRAGARGETLLGSGRAVTADTPFLIGSISKSFTALAVMQLVEAGKVDLDAPVARYLPGFADGPGAAVTVRQLLSHTSGYSTLQGNRAPEGGGAEALARHVSEIAEWAPAYQAGTHWEYSNANYQILGALIETVSGQRYADYVTAHILRPIGMAHSKVVQAEVLSDMATGHRPWFGGTRPYAGNRPGAAIAPAGGIVASANDLGKYLAMMLNGQDDLISAESKAAMMQPASDASPHYGLGWFVAPADGTVFHSGTSPGFEATAVLVPAAGKGALVLTNGGSGMGFGVTAPLRDGIIARALGLDIPPPPALGWAKTFFVGLVAMPLIFIVCIVWALTHRGALRAKSGVAGTFSLYFPLVAMPALAFVLVWLVPSMFGVSLTTLHRFSPDLAILLAAGAISGLAWAVIRLGVARGGKAASG